MFVSHEVTLPVGFEVARARLQNLVHGRALIEASRESYGDGITGQVRVGPAPGVSRLVRARFRDLVIHGETAVLTLRWEAAGPGGGLFPALDADVTLSPAGPRTAKLRLDGSYRPPLGAVGERLDRAILHRVAAATIQSFMARVAAVVAEPATAVAPEAVAGIEPVWDAPPP